MELLFGLGLVTYLLVFLAGIVGGLINAAAGGGMFVLFPMLIFCGVSSVSASATTSMAVLPGTMAAAWTYRQALSHSKPAAVWVAVFSALGGIIGGYLLLWIDNHSFARLAPFLMLFATIMFTISPWIQNLSMVSGRHPRRVAGLKIAVLLFLFANFIYGGFFGAGMGIMMLAGLTLYGMTDIHTMNALRTIASVSANSIAGILFIHAGVVDMKFLVPLASGTILGGLFGSRHFRSVRNDLMRRSITILAWLLTALTFAMRYLR